MEIGKSSFSRNIDSIVSKQEAKKENMGRMPSDLNFFIFIYYLGSSAAIIGVILLVLGLSSLSALEIEAVPYSILSSQINAGLLNTFSPYLIYIGIFFITYGILSFFIARGIKKAKKWSRVVVITISILGIMGSVYTLIFIDFINGLISVALPILFMYYFGFNKKVKEYFSKQD